ncbi:MAG: hypothetical protein F6K40_20525 [Okeania sp. SIO3I5]|uniref:hypothetical protein n=1 Tax=Okeania sp. SIO3I5 TaxID=2607805 RepID=UPI0013B95ADE|nr:hypothetical protein [Okeania sp. SIO3I5]NEQ38523.1 hypothetical protein [Okeania sp. SIO3I5]
MWEVWEVWSVWGVKDSSLGSATPKNLLLSKREDFSFLTPYSLLPQFFILVIQRDMI